MAKYIIPVIDTEKFRKRLRYIREEYDANQIQFERILVKKALSSIRDAIKNKQPYSVFNIIEPDLVYHSFMGPQFNVGMNSNLLNDWGFTATPCFEQIKVSNSNGTDSMFVVITWGKTPY